MYNMLFYVLPILLQHQNVMKMLFQMVKVRFHVPIMGKSYFGCTKTININDKLNKIDNL